MISVLERLADIRTAVNQVKEKRLLDQMQLRANDELSRVYFKTLDELRKQQ